MYVLWILAISFVAITAIVNMVAVRAYNVSYGLLEAFRAGLIIHIRYCLAFPLSALLGVRSASHNIVKSPL